ncbi:MAG: transporter [Pseudomonadota bacterium]
MKSAILLVIVTAFTLCGDYLIKLASERTNGMHSTMFLLGAVFYGLPAFGWFFLMRSHSLAAIGVLYSASTMLLLAALGVFAFNESFGLREGLGLSLAIAAVLVMSQSG